MERTGQHSTIFTKYVNVSHNQQQPPLITSTPDCSMNSDVMHSYIDQQQDEQQNKQHIHSIFSSLKMAPRDPILGVNQQFAADLRPDKINLSVGAYYDDNGEIPILECVKRAAAVLATTPKPRTYLPIEGLAAYNKAVQELVFGANSNVVLEKRVVTVQALGGTGALKLGADLIKHIEKENTKKGIVSNAQVWVSDPSWENHRGLFESAGFVVNNYPYFAPATHGVNFEGMLNSLKSMPEGSIVLLHACCHNPTGADLTAAQWTQVIDVVASRNLTPFLDMAYQGFGEGIDADGAVVRRFADAGVSLFVSNSFSKSVSIYGERVGALSIVTANQIEAECVLSHTKAYAIRTNYSSPPRYGAEIVATILTTPELRIKWEEELNGMRQRINENRKLFVSKLKEKAPDHDFSFIEHQRGMFSYSGLTKEQVTQVCINHAIYALDNGRMCMAALNAKNIDVVVDAICQVL